MNILVICHYGLYEDLSSSFVHQPVKALAALGHKVRVIVPCAYGKPGRDGSRFGKPLQISQIDGVTLYDIRYLSLSGHGERGFNTKSAIAAIRPHLGRILLQFAPDVIHAHTLGFDSGIGAWLKERLSCPLIVTTHGGDTNRPLARGEQHLLRAYCAPADQIIAVSSQLGRTLAKCCTDTPIGVIHNGFIPRAAEAVEKEPYGLIQVGHLIPSKHFDTTIRAFSRLKDKYPAMTLTIVGQGPLREQLEELCKLEGVAHRVTFTGQIPNEEVFSRMCRASFFVMASAPEGFGIVYLEAMAAGCLTIGARGQGIADLIEHGENGYLVPPEDDAAIADILDASLQNPEEAAAIAARGQALARTMTWERCAGQYEALFYRLANPTEENS